VAQPAADQIEVCIFGPGYGECSVVHLGASNWIVIDSCLDTATGKPASVDYFSRIGVDPGAIGLIVATHWHDDHIRGMAQQVRTFVNARFCTSAALTNQEFIATIVAYDKRHAIVAGSGASEVCEVLEILRSRAGKSSSPMRAAPARLVFRLPASASGHGQECQVLTLSPSDKQFEKFMLQLGAFAPVERGAKRRVADQNPNDLSVVVLVSVGNQGILLGGDLEEAGDDGLGWSAIVQLPERPAHIADVFKIPHHGSENGHCQEVWDSMLNANAVAVLTPWNKNQGLPTKSDVGRIIGLTDAAFSTSAVARRIDRIRPYSVEKQIRETVGRMRPIEGATGFVRLRNGGAKAPATWCIELSDQARHLKDLQASW
jgi:hypothetical protein